MRASLSWNPGRFYDVDAKYGVEVEANYFLRRRFSLGLVGEIAPAHVSESGYVGSAESGLCTDVPTDCKGADYRVGIQALFYLEPASKWAPFVGFGAGYEWLHTSAIHHAPTFDAVYTGPVRYDVTSTRKGFEILRVQVGGMYALSRDFALGPTFATSFTLFTSEHGTSSEYPLYPTYSDNRVSPIIWVSVGVRGTFTVH